jgi:SAM-dependent methyltransferase
MLEPYEHKRFDNYKPRKRINLKLNERHVYRDSPNYLYSNRLERTLSRSYLRKRNYYDYEYLFTQFWHKLRHIKLREIVEDKIKCSGNRRPSVLEIGPGKGYFIKDLRRRFYNKFDYDAITKDDYDLIELQKKGLIRDLILDSAENVKLDKQYDLIVDVYSAIYYLDKITKIRLLVKLLRQLKPSGVIFIADYGDSGVSERLLEYLQEKGYYVIEGINGLMIIKPPLPNYIKLK